MQLQGKSVFLTGGAMGVGKAVAEALLTAGAKVVIVDVNQQVGEATATALQKTHGQDSVTFIQCDVTNEDSLTGAFNSAVERLGSIDVMINNAGIMNEKIWKTMIVLNFNAVVVGTQLALEHMRKDKGGKGGVIINTASFVGLLPMYQGPVYAGTKHAVVGFTRSWATNRHRAAMGVRFGLVCPAFVDTALVRCADDEILHAEDFRQAMAHVGALSTEVVAKAFLKLVEDDDSNGACCTIEPSGNISYKSLVLQEGNLNFKGEPFNASQ